MRGSLDMERLMRLSRILARESALPAPSRAEVWEAVTSPVPQPLISRGLNAALWTDKYYVARQLGKGEVEYIYLSFTHICEEIQSFALSARQRGEKNRMPAEIRRQFGAALKYMRSNDCRIWVDERYRPLIF